MTPRTLLLATALYAAAVCPVFAGPGIEVEFRLNTDRFREALAGQAEYVAFTWLPGADAQSRDGGQRLRVAGGFRLSALFRSDGEPRGDGARVTARKHRGPSDMPLGRIEGAVVARDRVVEFVDMRTAKIVLSERAIDGQDAFEITWEGRFVVEADGGGWQILEAVGGKLEIGLSGTWFKEEIQRAVRNAQTLLRESRGAGKDLAVGFRATRTATESGGVGLSGALSQFEDTSAGEPATPSLWKQASTSINSQLQLARYRISRGNLVMGQVALDRAQELGGSPEIPVLRQWLNAKQGVLERIFRNSRQLRSDGEFQLAYELVGDYYHGEADDGWSLSSALAFDMAQSLVGVDRNKEALEYLSWARGRDPGLTIDPLFQETLGQATQASSPRR